MTMGSALSRRGLLKSGVAGVALLSAPAFIRRAWANGPIKIGVPCALTGPLAAVGQMTKRGSEFFAKEQNAKGGLLGRPVELIVEDTQGNPASCVRKTQEMVERSDCRLITGVTASSEALALVPKLAEWNAVFMSSINGDGRLTAESPVPNFFRANTSGPMGTRAISLFLRDSKMKSFFALGMDYAWGHNSVGVFEDELKRAGKQFARQDVLAHRNQGFLDLHHEDPPVRRRRRVPGARGGRQQRLPVAGTPVPARSEDDADDRAAGTGEREGRRRGSGWPDRRFALPVHLRKPEEQGVRRSLQGRDGRCSRPVRGRGLSRPQGSRAGHREGEEHRARAAADRAGRDGA